jgi:hypothetical protein
MEAGINKWFDTVMDRASDVFTRWTRVITVAISVLLVVILHMDAGLILHQISTNPEVKAGLLKMSDSALAQADERLGKEKGSRGLAALQEVAKQHTGDSVSADLKDKAESYAKTTDLSSCIHGGDWLKNYPMPSDSKADKDQLAGEFEKACQGQTLAALDQSKDSIAKIRNDLAATDLKLIPDGVNGLADGFRSSLDEVDVLGVLLALGDPVVFPGASAGRDSRREMRTRRIPSEASMTSAARASSARSASTRASPRRAVATAEAKRSATSLSALPDSASHRDRSAVNRAAAPGLDGASAMEVAGGVDFLVRVAERENVRTVFTVDKRDFAVYRLHGRTRLRIVP